MSSVGYFFKESLQGFARNFSTALGSIVTIFLSLCIIGIFLVAGVLVDNLMSSIENEVTITAYVADDADQEDIDKVMSDVASMSDVATVSFTTKDEAMESFRDSMVSDPEIIDSLDGTNPLPASIDIELTDPQKVEDVANALQEDETYARICDKPDDVSQSIIYGQETVNRLFTITNYVRLIGLIFIILLVFIALVFINNTIRLAILARRREISIMRLVGASNGFIRGPFLMEGALHALIGSLLAVLVIQLIRIFAIPQLNNAIQFLNFDMSPLTYWIICIGLVVLGVLIGLIGSAFAMRRYLRV